uniref:Uncharacterized protein n=1 Tax=Panagrolaimus sp. PS1159 TaxID=55785 RepID=A0AC35F996_9BILA
MGRRKQANPIRVGLDESVLATSSTSPSTTTTSSSASLPSTTPPQSKLSPTNKHNGITTIYGGPTAAKKPKTDFSIKSHLEEAKSTNSSSSSFNPSLSPQSLSNALKAYETLLNELNRQPNGLKPGPLLQLTKQVDKLSSKDGKRDPG